MNTMNDELIIKNMTAKVIEKESIKDEKLARILMETYNDVHNLYMKTMRYQFDLEERYYSEYYELWAHCLDSHITKEVKETPEYEKIREFRTVSNFLSHLSDELSEFETHIYNFTSIEHPGYISWSDNIKEEYVRDRFLKKLTKDHEDKIFEFKNKFFKNPKYLPIIQHKREQIIKKLEELLKKEADYQHTEITDD